MNLVCVIPSLQPGGMERVMATLLHHFAHENQKINLHLVLYGRTRDIFYEIPPSIKVYRPSFGFSNRLRFFYTLKTIWFLRRTIEKLKADSIISFGERWNNLVLLAGLGKNWPIYLSDRCQPDKSLGMLQDRLRKWLYPRAFGIIAQTEQAKHIYQNWRLNSNIRVIGNPVQQANPITFDEREKIVLTVGRLIHTKHHAELIRLFAEIDIPAWKLVIVGGDALKQDNMSKLKKLISKQRLSDRVMLTGTVKEVSNWYRKSSIFAFPSSSEGFPNVVGEALSYGLPVVAFDCVAGPRDMVVDGMNGFLVDVMDFEEFQTRLRQLMVDSDLRIKMAERAPSSIRKFDVQVIGKQFHQTLISHL